MKLTLISVYADNRRVSIFAMLPVGEDGKVRIPTNLLGKIQNYLEVSERGQTFSAG